MTKPKKPTSKEPKKEPSNTEVSTEHQTLIDKAIEDGHAVLKDGKSKIDAAMTMYRQLSELPQDVVVQAFKKGANLTDQGAVTYWYNCRRKFNREKVDNPT